MTNQEYKIISEALKNLQEDLTNAIDSHTQNVINLIEAHTDEEI